MLNKNSTQGEFKVEAGKQHQLLAGDSSCYVQIHNNSSGVMRVILADMSGNNVGTLPLAPDCSGIYAASNILIRAIEKSVAGNVVFLEST